MPLDDAIPPVEPLERDDSLLATPPPHTAMSRVDTNERGTSVSDIHDLARAAARDRMHSRVAELRGESVRVRYIAKLKFRRNRDVYVTNPNFAEMYEKLVGEVLVGPEVDTEGDNRHIGPAAGVMCLGVAQA